MSELPKSELAIKRDEWFESMEGSKCLDRSILRYSADQDHLKNRLEAAFLAGANASTEVQEEFCEEIISHL